MEIKDLKKLFGNRTNFTENFSEYQYGFGYGNSRGKGGVCFPVNGDDCEKAKRLQLNDPKTEDLSWISDVFPNIQILELTDNKQEKKLKSLKGIERLSNLKTIIINSQFDRDYNILINELPSNIDELYLWYCTFDMSSIKNKFNFIYLHETKIINFENIDTIACNYLKFYKVNDASGSLIEGVDFDGNFKDFKR